MEPEPVAEPSPAPASERPVRAAAQKAAQKKAEEVALDHRLAAAEFVLSGFQNSIRDAEQVGELDFEGRGVPLLVVRLSGCVPCLADRPGVPAVLWVRSAGSALQHDCVAFWMEPVALLLHDSHENVGQVVADARAALGGGAGSDAPVTRWAIEYHDAVGRRSASSSLGVEAGRVGVAQAAELDSAAVLRRLPSDHSWALGRGAASEGARGESGGDGGVGAVGLDAAAGQGSMGRCELDTPSGVADRIGGRREHDSGDASAGGEDSAISQGNGVQGSSPA